ncbi:hypothetical protein PV08_01905 [Exophiala spinifera]|uniref:AB hydrolase-1 domain-containing protein n=1 Tax=Exophiala spinifera TaxID=91928 RepID=A0A0D2BSB3_9EURO|nr:uncharacterized protein PV08_01905 [Exophiala spinifera]KIW21325.1 hypothetical protein PV08_01905 [Exophiala spinifera]
MSASKVDVRPAKLLSSRAYRVPGQLLITEYFFKVPLDHADPDGEQIRLFCRAGEKVQNAVVPKEPEYLPWFVYITGGPGFPGRPPQDQPGLTNEVLDRGYKFLSFDHRGMGLSTPVTADTLMLKGDPEAQARYLKLFRADNAVRDLEAIRKCLTAEYPADDDRRKWTVMGQSYGGYVCFTYLSFYPEGLREAFPLGGTPPVTALRPDEPIRRLFRKVLERNDLFFAKFPEDKANVQRVARHIAEHKPTLPSGVALTPARFLELGIHLGFHGGFDIVHAVVLRAVNDLELFGFLTRPTLTEFENWPSFDNHPIYALLHGPLYAQGHASNWAFDRVRDEPEFAMFKHKDHQQQQQQGQDDVVYFTGEMVFRSVFSDNADLRRVAETAALLESNDDWPPLYDLDQLRRNTVPVYAAVFVDDMYVDLMFSLETAGLVKNYHMHLTNVMFHDAVRAKTRDVLKAVFSLRDDTLV